MLAVRGVCEVINAPLARHQGQAFLFFCRLTQDGDSEGCLHLDRLPNAAEAIAIREALGIRNWRTMTAIAWTNSALIWRKTPPIR
jgi:hypothetical protein